MYDFIRSRISSPVSTSTYLAFWLTLPVKSALTWMPSEPLEPFLVVIMMTPLEALDPKMAVAEASFRTVKLSMSLGLMEESASETPLMPVSERGRPSTTTRGLLLAFREEPPRILMVLAEPGAPSPIVTTTPADLPWSRSDGDVTIPLLSWSAFTEEIEPVMSLFLTVP